MRMHVSKLVKEQQNYYKDGTVSEREIKLCVKRNLISLDTINCYEAYQKHKSGGEML